MLPHFRAQRYGKIILLSGGGATKPMPFLSAYAASKAALVRFGETLADEVRDAGIDVNAVAPGALNTRLLDEVLEAGPAAVGQAFYEQSLKQKADRRHAARNRRRAVRVSRVTRERRHHRATDQRRVGSVAGPARAGATSSRPPTSTRSAASFPRIAARTGVAPK